MYYCICELCCVCSAGKDIGALLSNIGSAAASAPAAGGGAGASTSAPAKEEEKKEKEPEPESESDEDMGFGGSFIKHCPLLSQFYRDSIFHL